ncbi:MAG: cytochrome d ubiquinol oxidase subunit II [Bacteroidaceae bacterium]|nr:cytochrome d ubiquinol oxidase subunit II [Bacteroidaceae bacterium]
MITYELLQNYWWLLVTLLGALVVLLMFVQGANSQIFTLGKTEEERQLIVNSTGRKWEFTFTTLVTFGGAFFASFPLFYSTSFGGAYWVWMAILFTFVLQAVSYEFQSKLGNFLGKNTYRAFLVCNGVLAPILVGTAVSTFFHGGNFIVDKDVMVNSAAPAISRWTTAWHGLEAVANPWNVVLGLVVFFLARVLGDLYLINNVKDGDFTPRVRRQLLTDAVVFVILFLAYVGHLLMMDGWAVDPATGIVSLEAYKYLNNFLALPAVLALFLVGVVLALAGIGLTLVKPNFVRGIWLTGAGATFAVWSLLMVAGFNNTAYYPSLADPQSSLTLANSCSSEFTLTAMSVVSLAIPFVLAYIFYAWRAIDRHSITKEELADSEHKY